MTTIATSKDAMAQAEVRMEKAVEDFRKELAGVRTGRANVPCWITSASTITARRCRSISWARSPCLSRHDS